MTSCKIITKCVLEESNLRLLPSDNFISYMMMGGNAKKSLEKFKADSDMKSLKKSYPTTLTQGQIKNFENFLSEKHKTSPTTLKSQIIPLLEFMDQRIKEQTGCDFYKEMLLKRVQNEPFLSKLELIIETYDLNLKAWDLNLKNMGRKKDFFSFELQRYVNIYKEILKVKDINALNKQLDEKKYSYPCNTEKPLHLYYYRCFSSNSESDETIEELCSFTLDDFLYLISCVLCMATKNNHDVLYELIKFLLNSISNDLRDNKLKNTAFYYYTNALKNIFNISLNEIYKAFNMDERIFDYYRSGKRTPALSVINHLDFYMSFYITVLLVNLLTKTTFVDDEIELVIQKLKEFDNIKKIAEENYKKYESETN